MPHGRIDRKAIEQFISLVDMGVEALANNPPRDPLSATDILVAKTPEFQARIGMDLQLGKRGRGSSAGREPLESGTTQISTTRIQLQEKIVQYGQASTSAYDDLRRLALLSSEIRNSRISGPEKSELLTLVALNEEFVRYLDYKVGEITKSGGQVAPAMKCSGWWSCWGKCVAGTVGGAGLGALTGATYGGVGCTMVLPVVGTVACGSVGAIAGGVFGGLAGAATAC